jgi:hypothetical protein
VILGWQTVYYFFCDETYLRAAELRNICRKEDDNCVIRCSAPKFINHFYVSARCTYWVHPDIQSTNIVVRGTFFSGNCDYLLFHFLPTAFSFLCPCLCLFY